MDITFACESCGQSIVIDGAAAGQLVDCLKCGKPLEVPYKSKPLDKAATPSPPTVRPACCVVGNGERTMKKTVWIYLAMLTVATVLTGCGKQKEVVVVPKKRQISGQVFVATQGGESRKLGDIPVALYDEETISSFQTNIMSHLQKTQSEIAKVSTLIDADKQSIVADKQSIVANEQSIVADEKSIVADQQTLNNHSEIVARELDAIE